MSEKEEEQPLLSDKYKRYYEGSKRTNQELSERKIEKYEGPECNKGIVKIEIMDTGIGINKANIQKLFQPFQQATANISKIMAEPVWAFGFQRAFLHKCVERYQLKVKKNKVLTS